MARKPLSDYLATYRKKIDTSKRWRKEEGYDQIWKRMSDLYRGRHYDYYSESDRLLVNICFSTVNVIVPTVAVNYPKITVNATKPESAAQAVIAEAVVNYWWKHNSIKDEFKNAVKDMVIFGHGWIKVGYRYVEEESFSIEGDDVSDDVEGGEATPRTVVVEDAPFAERVSPSDVFVDPDATSMKDIAWIAQRIRRPLREVRTDKRYNKSAREAVGAMAISRYGDDPSVRKVRDKDEGYAEIWEFYDVKNRMMCVFSEAGDGFLVKPMKMPYAFGQPFVMLRDYDVPDQFYPIGELEAIEPLQKELNETRTQMMNHRKRFARKWLYKESAFDQLGRTALESDEDNVMVPVVGDDALGNVIAPMPAVINPPDFYNQSNVISADIDRVSGVSEFMRGGVTEIRRTATESALLQDAANARTADKLATVERGISEVGRRLVILAQQFMTGEQVARITSRSGDPVWVKYDRDYLAGDFDFDVVGGSTQPINESFRRQQALQIVDAMAPFAGAGVVDMGKLAAYVLQFGFGVKSPEQFLQSAPPPQPPAGQAALSMPSEGGVPIPPTNPTVPQQAEAGMAGFDQSLQG
jgi:hypothetical protein